IDGPAAAGKGTIARALAEHFGLGHLDTGLLYRAVGAKVLAGAGPVEAARSLTPGDLSGDLRTNEVAEAASRVAVIPEVRAALRDFQRDFAKREGGAVLDGRDIGTVICPEADVKLFVTARPEIRARRRWQELGGDFEAVLEEVRERDARDAGRALSPMKPAPDALILDTSEMSIEQAVAAAINHVAAARRKKRGGDPAPDV
ncbi:MAG TPA: (d)CMP kinase, partial [Aliiroseovarius sp.]|nr:(d)CMP kinase [Aliiroseovarius sp.]